MGLSIEEQREKIRAKKRELALSKIASKLIKDSKNKNHKKPKPKSKKKKESYKEFTRKIENQRKAAINSKKLRKKITKAEKIVKQCFDEDKVVYRFQKQFYSSDACYIVDFYFKNKYNQKYVIEIDGSSHDSEAAKLYDAKRTAFLSNVRHCTVVRFRNEEVFNNIDNVIEQIYSLNPIFA